MILSMSALAQFGAGGPTVAQEVFVEGDGVEAGAAVRVVLRFRLDEGWHVNANKPLEEFLIPTVVSLEENAQFSVIRVVYPEAETMSFAFSPDQLVAVYEHEFSVGLVVGVSEELGVGGKVVAGNLRYQACNDKLCAPPKDLAFDVAVNVVAAGTVVQTQHAAVFAGVDWSEEGVDSTGIVGKVADSGDVESVGGVAWAALADRFEVTGKTAFLRKDDFLAFLSSVEAGDPTAAEDNKWAGWSWWLILGAVLGGGFLLNITPCVYPLIPINIAIIGAGAKAGSRMRGFSLGGVYGVGISLVYGLLGLVVVLGVSTAFGTINSTVWFNASMTVLFVVLGLAMFDLITIDFSRFQAKLGIKSNENGSFIIAFVMGCVSALLAGACVAPAVISTIVYAQDQYSQGQKLALFLPFFLGVGMALPWPFLGAGLSSMPKPGMWMVRVKQGIGVFILAFAVYYGNIAYGLMSARGGDMDIAEGGWVQSLENGLALAEEEQKPVIIDFWATWCKNCYVMDEVVFQDEEVLERLDEYVKIKYDATAFSESPVVEVMDKYKILALPAIIVLEPNS